MNARFFNLLQRFRSPLRVTGGDLPQNSVDRPPHIRLPRPYAKDILIQAGAFIKRSPSRLRMSTIRTSNDKPPATILLSIFIAAAPTY